MTKGNETNNGTSAYLFIHVLRDLQDQQRRWYEAELLVTA